MAKVRFSGLRGGLCDCANGWPFNWLRVAARKKLRAKFQFWVGDHHVEGVVVGINWIDDDLCGVVNAKKQQHIVWRCVSPTTNLEVVRIVDGWIC